MNSAPFFPVTALSKHDGPRRRELDGDREAYHRDGKCQQEQAAEHEIFDALDQAPHAVERAGVDDVADLFGLEAQGEAEREHEAVFVRIQIVVGVAYLAGELDQLASTHDRAFDQFLGKLGQVELARVERVDALLQARR